MAKRRAKAKTGASIDALLKAKSVYTEHGDVNSCDDWLALTLNAFRTGGGNFDLTVFKACLKENGIEAPKADMERHDAIGRFTMCAGLMLRRPASKVGHVVIGGRKIVAPGTRKQGRKAKAVAGA